MKIPDAKGVCFLIVYLKIYDQYPRKASLAIVASEFPL